MGMLALLTGRSLQARVLIPLLANLGFGLLASSILARLVVPAFHAIVNDLGMARVAQAS